MEDLKKDDLAAEMYANDPDDFTDKTEKILTLMLQAGLRKRNGNFDEAIPLWKKALELGSIEAGIQLAKVCEHKLKDIPQAIHYAQASRILADTISNKNSKEKYLQEINHRLNRLSSKLYDGDHH